ncbi:hypothetical protein EYC84_008771 [Monilinia fructicola]|uniref:Peptidase M14 domain-containing protein n=1 Tax=Monilinia fructicola TaxID=38448 RepID=A0A5M9JE29_MONFR|nr:hypothetical protein EYC84_008771 [Monilinia fructicola]
MRFFQIITLATAAAVTGTAAGEKVNYDGYQVFRLKAENSNIEKINDIVTSLDLQTWKKSTKLGTADVVVPPQQVKNFLKITEDFQREVMHTLAPNATWFTAYHAYADHIQFLKDLVTEYPSNAEIVTSGNSVQGNAITGIHIYGSSGKGVKPAVIFHGTVHAREWITTLKYMAYNLLTNYATNTEIKGFVDKYDYYIFPVVNPDAYGYSCTALAENNAQLQSLAASYVAAVKAVYGTSFGYGPICSTIYQATGNSVDYVDATVGADFTFTTELRDTGTYGFVLPASQITPSAIEAFAGVRSLLINMT